MQNGRLDSWTTIVPSTVWDVDEHLKLICFLSLDIEWPSQCNQHHKPLQSDYLCRFHIDPITSFYDIESMLTKMEGCNFDLSIFILLRHYEMSLWSESMLSQHWKGIKSWRLCINTDSALNVGYLYFEISRPKMVVLGSREQMCIHHDVQSMRGRAQNHACRSLTRGRNCHHYNRVAGKMGIIHCSQCRYLKFSCQRS